MLQIIKPPSWISQKTYDVTNHVQCESYSKKYRTFDFKTKNEQLFEIFRWYMETKCTTDFKTKKKWKLGLKISVDIWSKIPNSRSLTKQGVENDVTIATRSWYLCRKFFSACSPINFSNSHPIWWLITWIPCRKVLDGWNKHGLVPSPLPPVMNWVNYPWPNGSASLQVYNLFPTCTSSGCQLAWSFNDLHAWTCVNLHRISGYKLFNVWSHNKRLSQVNATKRKLNAKFENLHGLASHFDQVNNNMNVSSKYFQLLSFFLKTYSRWKL